ncbi:hypothetical protein J3459_009907 [Metarhizium acridum]|uniref:uncharacterized protein n=1 Tax=Metarhizium acridum TaxID=92637 RepID=UPI001C6C813A|nr:hypothetical protein J3459_009907 [Metarhizium acridum]KAG8424827.1 hypothetical protein J3458_001588 [Metarhizium acridum]
MALWPEGTKCVKIIWVLDVAGGDVNAAQDRDEYRILLVIARTFRQAHDGYFIDYHASLVQSSLLRIALSTRDKRLQPQFSIEVIRPSTFDVFQKHIRCRGTCWFDLVHLDVHGKFISDDSAANCTRQHSASSLRSAKRFDALLEKNRPSRRQGNF